MALIKQHKFVAALPATLEADSIYFVRTGVGFDQYVTNSSGQIVAYPANDKWDSLKTPAIASGALALDLSSPAGFRVALNQNVTALTFAGVPSGRVVVFTITWVQDATGGRSVAFPASVKADGGGAPVQPVAGANAVTVQSFYTDDGGVTVWQASAGVASSDVGFTILYPNGGSAATPANASVNSRYISTNPFADSNVICLAQIRVSGQWVETGWYVAYADRNYSQGVKAGQLGNSIIVQTGRDGLMTSAVDSGNPSGSASGVTSPTPFRVLVWKVKGSMT